MTKPKEVTIRYLQPVKVTVTMKKVQDTLKEVKKQLLNHQINGGGKKLEMNSVCDVSHTCGTAACIGGWTSLFLLGFEKPETLNERGAVSDLFEGMARMDQKLSALFYDYDYTEDYNEPNIAATAIHRYLNGQKPWPKGDMPKPLRYAKA
jgi:hypothetical protein